MKHEDHVTTAPRQQVEISRKFNGVWIPASLWLREDLTWFQKCLLAEVASLGECFASNEYLAKMMKTTNGVIRNELSKLRKKGLILDWGFDGRKRQLTVAREVHPNPFGNPSSTDDSSRHPEVNIDTRKILVSKESKETGSSPVGSFSSAIEEENQEDFPAQWKPHPSRFKTKEEQLKKLHVPRDYPSEIEFEQFLLNADCNFIIDKRSNLYSDLCDQKWHQWQPNPDGGRWRKIQDWRSYVRALERKMQGA